MQNRPTIGEQLENHHDDMGSRAEDEIDNMHLSDDENLLMTRHSVFFPEEPHHEEVIAKSTNYCLPYAHNIPDILCCLFNALGWKRCDPV
jgi:hypothetical protein